MTPLKLIEELIFALECQELTEVIRDGRPFSGRGRGGGRRFLQADDSGDLVVVAVVPVQVVAVVDRGFRSVALDVVVRKVGHRVAELAVGGERLGSDVAELLASDIGLEKGWNMPASRFQFKRL